MDIRNTEYDLIFGDLLEGIIDIKRLNEKVTAGNMNQATKNYVAAAKTGNAIVASNAKTTLDNIQRQAALEASKEKKKDPVSGEKELHEENTATEFAKKNLENKVAAMDRLNDQIRKDHQEDEKKKDTLQKQIDAARARVSAVNNADSITESENEIEKKASLAKEEQLEQKEKEDGIASAEKSLTEAESPEGDTPVTISARRFSKMLFNGSSGDALKYFIYGDINDGNREEINIAKKMKNDREVNSTIRKIEFLLRRASSGKFSDATYQELKIQKGKFRQLFHKFKNESK